jgi:hypothetical protein
MNGFLGRNSIALICRRELASFFAITESIIMPQKYKTQELTAAGGWVENEFGEVLWIFRLGMWDLPKGKLENDEELHECAIREVQEECGLKEITLGQKLIKTIHKYNIEGVSFKKTTHWYRMNVKGRPKLNPQFEEDIELAIWLTKKDWLSKLHSTYPTICQVSEAAMK